MNKTILNLWHNKWLLSIISGVLLGFSFPPFPFPFLQFPAFILIFRLISLSSTAKEAAYFSYPAFLIWNLITTYWLMMATLPAGIAAILANAVLMALVVMLQFTAQKRFTHGWLIALLQSAFWVSFEYLTHHWDLSWPWLSLGNGWSTLPALIQYISATGFLGISFWVMLGSALVYQAIQQRGTSQKIGAVAIILLFPIISLIQLSFVSTKSDINKTVETVIAQPNFDAYRDFDSPAAARNALSLLATLSDSVRTSQTQLILWPENGIHPYISNRHTRNFAAQQAQSRLMKYAAEWNSTIVGGTGYLEYYTTHNHPSLPQWSGNTPYLTYNAAAGFYPKGGTQIYRKHNLVTVVERFPFVHFFNAVDVFGLINWANIQGYGQGNKPAQFKAGPTKTPALICYDSVYPGWVRHFVQNGAGFISIITNDGWWGNTSGHVQHFDYARLRAIEFRRWVVQDSNNGTSGIIAPDGSVKKRTAFATRTAFRYKVPVMMQQTIYEEFGDWLPVGLLFISLIGICYFFIRRKR